MSAAARLRLPLFALAGALCLLAAMSAGRVDAAPMTFKVTLNSDGPAGTCDVTCTLREAIIAANNNPGHDTISFDPNVFPSTGSIIFPTSELDYLDASDGVTIDATDTPILIGCNHCGINFGLVFVSPIAVTARNIDVRGVSASGFAYDGIQVCPGPDIGSGTCLSDVDNVFIGSAFNQQNTADGVRILGANISNVTLDLVWGTSNGSGIGVQTTNALTNLTLQNNTRGDDNGVNGIDVSSGGTTTGVSINGGSASRNGDTGLRMMGGTTSAVDITSFAANDNGNYGMTAFTNAASMYDVTATGVTANGNARGAEFSATAALTQVTVTGNSTFNNNTLSGLTTYGGLALGNITITNNVFDQNGDAIKVTSNAKADHVLVESNTVTGSTGIGITFEDEAADGANNIIRSNTVSGGAYDGVTVYGDHRPESTDSSSVTISRNTIFGNGKIGINLYSGNDQADDVTNNDPGDGDKGPNDLLNFPVLNGAVSNAVVGTACANCLVEVFQSDGDPSIHGEGKTFLNDATADAQGNFSVSLCGDVPFSYDSPLTATATDAEGNTSEFSQNYELPNGSINCPTATPTPSNTPTPTPSPTPTLAPGQHMQGDTNCDNHVRADDALPPLLNGAGLIMPAGANQCLPLENANVNCDAAVDELDALAILAFDAGASPLPQHEPCTNVGAIL